VPKAPATAFVIFGITGDLAARKLMPALYQLHRQGALHEDTILVGYGRSPLSDEALRTRLAESLARHAGWHDGADWATLEGRIHYVRGGYDEPEGFRRLAERLEGWGRDNRTFYTATPPQTYEPIVRNLAGAGLHEGGNGWSRLVIEKPFGDDLATARELNRHVLERFRE